MDPFEKLYDKIAVRKNERSAIGPYVGGNGRIDRAVSLILSDPSFPKSGSLLDVGGATGNLGYALRDHFDDRWVIDICHNCREPAESKGNKFYCLNVDLEGLAATAERTAYGFDLIVALDLIEHIIDPQGFARECWDALRPGGMVLINTPNIQFWRHLQSLVCDGVFPHTSGDHEVYHGGHTSFFNLHDMKRIFGEAGFIEHRMHTEQLVAEPPPPIWSSLARYQNAGLQLSYADLVFSCRRSR